MPNCSSVSKSNDNLITTDSFDNSEVFEELISLQEPHSYKSFVCELNYHSFSVLLFSQQKENM